MLLMFTPWEVIWQMNTGNSWFVWISKKSRCGYKWKLCHGSGFGLGWVGNINKRRAGVIVWLDVAVC